MADNFDFAALTKSWQQQPIAGDAPPDSGDLAKAYQRQREQKILMYAEWLGAVIMLLTAFWLVFAMPDWLGYVSALFLLLGAISTAYISWQIHRPILAYDNWSSSGILQFRCRACQLSLRYYRYSQLSCVALMLFSLILWLLDWWQLASVAPPLQLFYSLVVSPICLFAIFRLQRKAQLKAAELQQLTTLADEFN